MEKRKIVWLPSARTEVGDIYASLLEISPNLADNWYKEVERCMRLLVEFPEMGRIVPEKEIHFLREMMAGKYRIIYTYLNDIITIISVWPSRIPIGKI